MSFFKRKGRTTQSSTKSTQKRKTDEDEPETLPKRQRKTKPSSDILTSINEESNVIQQPAGPASSRARRYATRATDNSVPVQELIHDNDEPVNKRPRRTKKTDRSPVRIMEEAQSVQAIRTPLDLMAGLSVDTELLRNDGGGKAQFRKKRGNDPFNRIDLE